MLRFLLFSEAAQPVEIDKKHYKWHVTNNNIFQLQQRVSNALKFIQNFKIPLVFTVFSHLISLVFIKERPVSSFWVLRFRSRGLRFRDLGASFSI